MKRTGEGKEWKNTERTERNRKILEREELKSDMRHTGTINGYNKTGNTRKTQEKQETES